jgi:hypothetical protein
MNKRIVCLVAACFLLFVSASAKDVYVSQSGAGSGSSAQDTRPLAWLNDARSWNTGGSSIAPGDKVHLVGTFTNPLIIQGDGQIGNPITIYFEPGAQFTSPCWPASGAIQLNGRSHIVIDGGVNGLIQNTNNGTGLSTNSSSGVYGLAYFTTIQNLTITNIFRKIKGIIDDTRQGYPMNLQGSSITVSNCVVSDGDCGVSYSAALNLQANYTVIGNKFFNLNHSTQIGMKSSNCLLQNVVFANNYFDNWDVWDAPGDTQIHLDGIWIWNDTYDPTSVLDNIRIYGNEFGGNVGTRTTSSLAFYLYNGRYQLKNAYIYNNLFRCYAPGSWGGGFISMVGSNVWVFNNTIVGSYSDGRLYGGRIILGNEAAYCYNNLMVYGSGLQIIAASTDASATDNSGSNTSFILNTYMRNIWSDYNIYTDYGQNLAQFGCEYHQAPIGSQWLSGSMTGLLNWKTWINNNRNMALPIWNTAHADPHSSTSTPYFVPGTVIPSTGDTVAYNAGTNLTQQTGVTVDFNGNPRPTSGPWTIGAFVPITGDNVASVTSGRANRIAPSQVSPPRNLRRVQ